MLITKTIEIDMGHRVPNHKSKCRNLHGHRYKVEVGVDDKVVTDAGASDEGMVIDFGDLKKIMTDYLDFTFDHGLMLWDKDPLLYTLQDDEVGKDLKIIKVNFVPTAENLAKYWYDDLKQLLLLKSIKISNVKIWETPTSTAEYYE